MSVVALWGEAISDAEMVVLHFIRSISSPASMPPLSDAALHKYASALFVLCELYRAWRIPRTGAVVCTERDLYYRAPHLFKSSGQRGVQAALARLGVWLSQSQNQLLTEKAGAAAARAWFTTRAPSSSLVREGYVARYTREQLGVMAVAKARLIGRLVVTDSHAGVDGAASGTSFWHLGGLAGLPVSWQSVGPADVHFHFAAAHNLDEIAHLTGSRAPLSLLEGSLHKALVRAAAAYTPCGDAAPLALVLVEKECVAHTLTHGPLGPCLARMCLVLSTRGYPCVSARHLVRRLHARWPTMPLWHVVDGDPHGLAILLVMMGLSLTEPVKAALSDDGVMGTASAPPSSPLLPIEWIALRPSTLTEAQENGAASLSTRARQATAVPLAETDHALLARLARVVKAALARTEYNPSDLRSTSDAVVLSVDAQIATRCLEDVNTEVAFLMRSRVKYELEAAQRVCD